MSRLLLVLVAPLFLAAAPHDEPDLPGFEPAAERFADAAGCRAIACWVQDRRRRGQRVRLVGAPALFAREWELLGYGDLAPVAVRSEAA